MSGMQQFVVTVIGGLAAIVVGVLGLVGTPPILATGEALSIGLMIAGLAVLGIGPVRTAYGVAKAPVE